MLKCRFIPLSKNPKDTEIIVNDNIFVIEHNSKCEYNVSMCKPTDDNKFMLVYDEEVGPGVASPSIGIRCVKTSENYVETEALINDALIEMSEEGDKSFVSIWHPVDNYYIILFEYKAGTFPFVKINPVGVVPSNASYFISKQFEIMKEESNLIPYANFMVDKDHMMFLCE